MRKFLILIPIALLLTFCAANPGPAAPTADIAAMVNATLTAYVPEQAEAAVALPAPTGGSITGAISYPSGVVPALKVIAFMGGSEQFFSIEIPANQTAYRFDNLPEGKYRVVAYTLGDATTQAGLAGGYTQAVLCGLAAECTEHSLVDVIVFNSETSSDVNISDWLQPGFPAMP